MESLGGDQAAERRGRLLGVKLRALVGEHLGVDSIDEPSTFAPGAALIHADEAWVLLDDQPSIRLGAALAWMRRAGGRSLNVIADRGTGVLARRADEFAVPISVWHADDRRLLAAVAEPHLSPPAVSAEHRRFAAVIAAAGADPIEEFGVLTGEVAGLEVCRVVDDAYSGAARLEVGVGTHDREAFAMIHGAEPAVEDLARVVALVAEQRRPGRSPHPLNRLAAERLLRWRLIAEPSLVDVIELHSSAPPVARQNLKDPVPCVADGIDRSGRPVVVVCSVGVDLDLIPYAADARLAAVASESAGACEAPRLVVVTPTRDRLPVTTELGALLRQPCELIAIDS